MKKILLVIAIFAVARVNAQIVNASFQNWDTLVSNFAGFAASGVTVVPAESFPYSDPVGWTSTNGISGDTVLGNLFLVTQTTNAWVGNSAVQVVTDTTAPITLPFGLGTKQLVVPGMLLNGTFAVSNIINSNTLLSGATITPGEVVGAGQPCTQRLSTFSGRYQYTPVQDTFTHSPDTCVIWAALRNGSTVVANAEFKSAVNTGGDYQPFLVNFNYVSCETPDTLVILISSSIPKFAAIIGGNTDLVPGSVLLVGTLGCDTLPAGSSIVLAANDVSAATSHTPDTIPVQANDCGSLAITTTITTQPANGTATVSNGTIIYTSNPGFVGTDSIYYSDTDPNDSTASAWVYITVSFGTGISEANQVAVKMFPVPASNQLNIQFDNNGKTTANIYDVVGNLIKVVTLTQNDNTINITNLTNGIYSLQLVDQSNSIIARGKFVVSK